MADNEAISPVERGTHATAPAAPAVPSVPGPEPEGPGRVEALRTRYLDAVDRLEASRSRSRVVDVAFRCYDHDVASGGGVLAGAVAFRIFLFMVPYVFVLVTAFPFLSDITGEDAAEAAKEAGVGGIVAATIGDVSEWSFSQRLWSVVLGGFALLWAARGLVKVLQITHVLIWRVDPSARRPLNRQALGLVGIVTALVVVSAALGKLRDLSLGIYLLAFLLWIGVPFAVWLFASQRLPHASVPWTALVPGAIFVAVATLMLSVATNTYFAWEAAKKADRYGALGVALVILLWAYCLGRILTGAAVLNSTMRSEQLPPVPEPERLTADSDAE